MEKFDLLAELEGAEAYLEEDLRAFSYLQDEYFGSSTVTSEFKFQYKEIQTALAILFKSMLLNHKGIKEVLQNVYEQKKSINSLNKEIVKEAC